MASLASLGAANPCAKWDEGRVRTLFEQEGLRGIFASPQAMRIMSGSSWSSSRLSADAGVLVDNDDDELDVEREALITLIRQWVDEDPMFTPWSYVGTCWPTPSA